MAAKYRKISPSIWNDAKFRNLSEQAKLIFFLLLTHPHTSAVGTIRAYQEGLACEMQWSAKQFRERFAELSSKGMVKVDETAGLIWLPNFMKHNMPENPNMLKSWKGSFDECPECCLKSEVFQACKLLAEQLGKGFKKAFDDCLSNGMPNQEQEQEQEQEEKEYTHASAKKSPSDQKITFGEHGNVKLLQREYDGLCEKYGQDNTEAAITFLDLHIAAKGKDPYKDHSAAMKKWVFRAVEEQRVKDAELSRCNPKNAFPW